MDEELKLKDSKKYKNVSKTRLFLTMPSLSLFITWEERKGNLTSHMDCSLRNPICLASLVMKIVVTQGDRGMVV